VIFIGIPLLIVWVKDRGGLIGLVVKRIFGAISLSFGVIIIGWVVYNMFRPTEEFEASFFTSFRLDKVTASFFMILRLALPITMIGLGWHWLTSTREEPMKESENKASDATSEPAQGTDSSAHQG